MSTLFGRPVIESDDVPPVTAENIVFMAKRFDHDYGTLIVWKTYEQFMQFEQGPRILKDAGISAEEFAEARAVVNEDGKGTVTVWTWEQAEGEVES